MHETLVSKVMGPLPDTGKWFVACESCDWYSWHQTEMSAVVAADHHGIMNQPNPRDRLMFLRVLIPPNVSDENAKRQIVKAVNLHTDCGVTGIPFWG